MLQENDWRVIQKAKKQSNMYGNKSISSPNVSSFFFQSLIVASYHGSAMSAVVLLLKIILGSRNSGRYSRRRGRPGKSRKGSIMK